MRLTRLLASLPVLAVVIATGCADGPLEGVRPVKYVKIEDANAATTKEPPPKAPATTRKDSATEEKPATATTSAASSTTESVEPDELINAAAGGRKPAGKGGKPAKPIGGAPKGTPDPFGGNPPTDEKCYRKGKDCCGDPIAGVPKEKGGAKECPKGTVLGGSCPKKKCDTKRS